MKKEKTEWLEIPGCEGYRVSRSADPRIMTVRGRVMRRATVRVRRPGGFRYTCIMAPRALYAAIRGIDITAIPMQYVVVMEDGVPVLHDRGVICGKARETYRRHRYDRQRQELELERVIRFHEAQAAALASGVYAELFNLCVSYYRSVIDGVHLIPQGDGESDGIDAALSLIDDIRSGVMVYDPVSAMRSKVFSIVMRRREERRRQVELDLSRMGRKEEGHEQG